MKRLILLLVVFTSTCFASDDWDRVYLASFPRSGNHWMRYLIEELTDVATSSVFHDDVPRHMKKRYPWVAFMPKNGYNGERRYPTQDDLVVVKTHYPCNNKNPGDNLPYIKTIRILRNPVDSFRSHYNWYRDFAKQRLGPGYLDTFIKDWRRFQEYWNKKPNVYTIRYEDLMTDTFGTLKGVVKELGLNCTDVDIQRAVDKHPPKGSILKHLNTFSNRQLDKIRGDLSDLLDDFNYEVPVKSSSQHR